MPYYLHHYFDPDFDFQHLKPVKKNDGSVDYYNMGYVQNVIQGQVLAEWEKVDENSLQKYEHRFIFDKIKSLVGRNCYINPKNKLQILSAANGYVFYLDGLINVKKVLNVRHDIDSRTGNIYFVGDVIAHGDVRGGFNVQARDIRVYGGVETSKLEATGSIVVDRGIKGGNSGLLVAEHNIKADFCEHSELRAGKSILLQTAGLHSELYAVHSIAVRGKLIGGNSYCLGTVYAGSQLGGGISTVTSIVVGLHPKLLVKQFQLENDILEAEQELQNLEIEARKGEIYAQQVVSPIKNLLKRLDIARRNLFKIKYEIEQRINYNAKVIVPGEVKPGVNINIAGIDLRINDYLKNVCFYLDGKDVKYRSPAI